MTYFPDKSKIVSGLNIVTFLGDKHLAIKYRNVFSLSELTEAKILILKGFSVFRVESIWFILELLKISLFLSKIIEVAINK